VTKAFAYLRVSGKGQVSGDGFPCQREAIKRYAQANAVKLVREFCDEGISGGSDLVDRPALSEMRDALLSNGVRLFLIERVDRFGARPHDSGVHSRRVPEARVRNRVGYQNLTSCRDDPTRILMRQLLGVFFQYEKTLIVNKLRGARNRIRTAAGRCGDRKPYGYLDGEKAVIERMVSLRGAGMSYERIADELNRAGVPTRKAGKRWFGSTVNGILAQTAPSARTSIRKRA
jgi:DNA invertase Pin-like site-specific DNA recombinase